MSVNIAELRQKLQEIKGKKSGTPDAEFLKKFYSPPFFDELNSMRSTVRILPGANDATTGEALPFYVEAHTHKINGKNVYCPKKIGKPCPICEEVRRLWAIETPETIAQARSIKSNKRYYMNVIARERIVKNPQTGQDEIHKNDGPLVYSCGVKVFERILRGMLKEGVGDITDLANGFDFLIEKEQQGDYPNYDTSDIVRMPSVAGSVEEMTNWMQNLHDLSMGITYKENAELAEEVKVFRGGGFISALATAQPEPTVTTTAPIAAPVQVAAPVATPTAAAPTAEDTDANLAKFMSELKKITKTT